MDWKSWKYKNLTILVSAFLLSVILGSVGPFKNLVNDSGLVAAFIAGIIFISTFTAPISAVTLLVLAEKIPLAELWFVAALGATLSDFFFFNLAKDGIASEIEPIYENLAGNHFHKVLRTRHFRWLFPVIGAAIILSPLPKTAGLHLLGIPKLNRTQFIVLSALMNIVGISFILILSFFIKP